MPAPKLRILALDLFEQDVPFTKPFRFGSSLVTRAPQAFVRATIEVEGRGTTTGATAEMMMPRWFDKRADMSPAATVDELRQSLTMARDLYLDGTARTAFAHHVAHDASQVAACLRADIPALAANYGPAVIDKAILDALLRATGLSFADGVRKNIFGLDNALSPDLDADGLARDLAQRRMVATIGIRHTVGLDDTLDDFAALARSHSLRWFKIKLVGDPAGDAERLARMASLIEGIQGQIGLSLDANEQYAEPGALTAFCDALTRDARLAPIATRLLYIEQPLPREKTFAQPLGALTDRIAFIIDEADDAWDAFPRARALGYRGVSAKSCKGLYKALVNGVRAAAWSTAGHCCFVSAEDLTCQAGLAVQQDTALAAVLGVTHVERNGHHYVDGFVDPRDANAFLAAHPDLYERHEGAVRLRTRDGLLPTASLNGVGFASGAAPPWTHLTPIASPADAQSSREFAQ